MRRPTLSLLVLLGLLVFLAGCREEEPPVTVGNQEEVRSPSFTLIEDVVNGEEVIVVGSVEHELVVSYQRRLATGEELFFVPSTKPLPTLMEDTEGNRWNVFGEALSGPRKGQFLVPTNSLMAYWFAIAGMYPGMDIYGGESSNAVGLPLDDPDWDIPTDSLAWASIWDGIQAMDDPEFIHYQSRDFLLDPFYVSENSMVTGVKIKGELKTYPHLVLNWHEIINDQVGGTDLSVAYCPLVGSSTVWDRSNGDGSFAVAGLLHNNNLMMFDRETESIWNQVTGRCVFGPRRGDRATPLQMIETTWKTWRLIDDEPLVLSENTGVNRDYTEDIFEFYRTNAPYTFYPMDVWDYRLPEKERVHVVVVGEEAKAYRFASFVN